MKFKLTAAEHAALDDSVKALYKANGDNFVLILDDVDVDGMARKNAELLDEKKKSAQAAAEAEAKRKAAEEEAAKKNGDVTALEKSWAEKLAAQEAAYKAQLDATSGSLNTLLVDNVALQVATSLCGDNAALMLPHLKGRLAAELQDGKPVTRVLAADGKPSALTVEELTKELAGDKRFAPILKGPGSQGTNVPGQVTKSIKEGASNLDIAKAAIAAMPTE